MSDDYIKSDKYTNSDGSDTPLWKEMLAAHSFLDLTAFAHSDVPDIAKSAFNVDQADRAVTAKGESTMGVGIMLRSLADVRNRPGKEAMSLTGICREIARMRDMLAFLHAAMREFVTEEDLDAYGPTALGGDIDTAPQLRRRLNDAIIRRDGAQQVRIAVAMMFARSITKVSASMRESLGDGSRMMLKMFDDFCNGEDLDGNVKIGEE